MTLPAITASYGNASLETKAATSGTSSPEPWFLDLLGGSQTASKVRVGPTTAMRVPAVSRAVNLIAGVFGHLPCRVLKIEDSGEAPAPDHPAFVIVNRRANPFTGAGQFRAQLVRDMLLHGNGYAFANRVGGKLRELTHLPAGSVTVEVDEATREPHYNVTVDGAVRTYHWSEIVHLSAPSLDGVSGKSPVHLGREAIGLAIVLERHAGRLFSNAARPGGIIMIPQGVGKDGRDRMRESWQRNHGGDSNGGTAILEGGADFKSIAFSSIDAEFNITRRQQTREIANVFNLPSTLLNDLDNGTYSNVEGLAQSFRDETLLPIIHALEFALERALLDEEETPAFRIAFDLEALDRADLSARAEAMAKRRAAAVTSANEERERLGLPAHEQGNNLTSPYTTPGVAKPEATPAEEGEAQ